MHVPTSVWMALGAVAAVLTIGSLLRCWLLRGAPAEEVRGRLGSLAVWWVMLLLLALAAVFGRAGVVLLVTALSVWAMCEYLALVGNGGGWRGARGLAITCLLLQAPWIYLGWYSVQAVFLPACAAALLPAWLVLTGQTEGFVKQVTRVAWGLLLTGYALGHAAALSVLPPSWNTPGGETGWFLFLVLIAQANDIAQALCGRAFGKRPLARRVSPRKTWEGLVGGAAVSVGLSLALAPLLTPLADGPSLTIVPGWPTLPACWPAVLAAAVIVVAGLLGDLTVSAIKRDLGVKDTGSILPTQGGILDRVDSLLLASPALYCLVCLLNR